MASNQTVASLLKSKPPVPYANMLRQVTGHLKKLQEELNVEVFFFGKKLQEEREAMWRWNGSKRNSSR